MKDNKMNFSHFIFDGWVTLDPLGDQNEVTFGVGVKKVYIYSLCRIRKYMDSDQLFVLRG